MVSTEKNSLKNIRFTLFAFFLLCMSAYVVMPMIPVFIKNNFKASMTDIAWITVGASIFGVIPSAIIGGRISDYIGQKVTIATALLIFGLSKFLFPYASTLFLLFLLRAIGGLYAAAFPATQAVLVNESRSPDERTRFMSYYVLAFGAGLTLGPILGGVIGQHWGLAEIFDATTYLSLIGAITILFITEKKKKVTKKKLLVVSNNPIFWLSAFTAFLCMGTMGTLLTVIPVFEINELNFSASRIGFSMALLTGSFAMFQFVIGGRLKEHMLGTAIQGGFIASSVGLLVLLAFAEKVPFLLAGLLMVGSGIGTAYVAATSMAAGTTTTENRGSVMGLFTASMNIGYGLLSVIVVYLASLIMLRAAFFILLFLLCIGTLICYMQRLPLQKTGVRYERD